MRTIYIDSDFKCHPSNDGTMTAVETDFFNGKCDTFVEGYRLIPDGEVWTREDGTECSGTSPWKDHSELDAAQREYEREILADAENALAIMWGGVAV